MPVSSSGDLRIPMQTAEGQHVYIQILYKAQKFLQ